MRKLPLMFVLLGGLAILTSDASAQVSANKTRAPLSFLQISCVPGIIPSGAPPTVTLPIFNDPLQPGAALAQGNLSLSPLAEASIYISARFSVSATNGLGCLQGINTTTTGLTPADVGVGIGGCLDIPASGLYFSAVANPGRFIHLSLSCLATLQND